MQPDDSTVADPHSCNQSRIKLKSGVSGGLCNECCYCHNSYDYYSKKNYCKNVHLLKKLSKHQRSGR